MKLAVLLLLVALPAHAATFTKIADGASPGMGWSVNVFFGTPALDAGVVAFTVADDFSRHGVYTGTGGALTTIDETAVTEGSYSDPSISQGVVAFGWSNGFTPTIYTGSGGGLTVIADPTTPDPGGSGTLNPNTAVAPSIDGANVAFGASSSEPGGGGLLTSVAGVLEISADRNTEVTGSGPGDLFIGNVPRGLDGTEIAFEAFHAPDISGVYVADGGVTRRVADQDTLVPGTSETFFDFSNVAIGGGSVVFEGIGTNAGGLYVEIAGVLFLVTDTEVVDGVAVDGDTVAWSGNDGLNNGLWVWQNGVKQRLIGGGDLLDGKPVIGFDFGAHGLDGEQLAFTALFEDGSEGVFLVLSPEPGTAALLAAGLAALAARRRR